MKKHIRELLMLVVLGLVINTLSYFISEEYFSNYLMVKYDYLALEAIGSFVVALLWGGSLFFIYGVITIFLLWILNISISKTVNFLIPTLTFLLILVLFFFYRLFTALSDWGGINIGGYTDNKLLYHSISSIQDIKSFYVIKGIQSFTWMTFFISLLISITFVKLRKARR
ncbi:MAG: hypothetical protein N4A35_04680 [Flavobacteriales bacterium]|nr:hypothetical protein [Flavobacteriales bacterium]